MFSVCGELWRKTTSPNVGEKKVFLSLTTKTLQLYNMTAGRDIRARLNREL